MGDTGGGVPSDIFEKILEPFFSTKEVGKGSGLGLSTVYGIVKQSGGFLFVDKIIKKGAGFSIFLPRHEPSTQTRSSDPTIRMVALHKASAAVYAETIPMLLV